MTAVLTTSSSVPGFAAASAGAGSPGLPLVQGTLLGSVVMFELREAISAPAEELAALWQSLGLPPRFTPKPRTGRDAFRAATPRRKLQNGLMLNEYKGPQEALPQGTELACVLVRATPTKDKAKFKHSNRAAVFLIEDDRLQPDGSIKRGLDVDFLAYADLTIQEQTYLAGIQDAWKRVQHQIDGSQLREAIAATLKSVNAVPFREGAYHIPSTYQSVTQALVDLIQNLNRWTPAEKPNRITTIDYVDTPNQQAQLEDVVHGFVEREIAAKVAEAADYAERCQAAKRPVGDRKRATMLGDLLALEELIGDYESVMQTNLKELRRQAAYTKQIVGDILAS